MAIKYTLEALKAINHPINRLAVIDFDKSEILPSGSEYKKIICQCSCGTIVSVSMYHFIHGRTKSCGCYRIKMGRRFQKYDPVIPGIYTSYKSMMRRCYDTNHKNYSNYGGRGVVVCEEWKSNYQLFLDWALGNGWSEGLELDKDINGNGLLYSPGTCCWVTKAKNNSTRKDTKKYIYQGELLNVSEISRKANIPITTLSTRIKKMGLSINEHILLTEK